jgi:hypothetical protein
MTTALTETESPDARSTDAPFAPCLVCGNDIPRGAALCTKCESWQLASRQRISRFAKGLLVLLVPAAAWYVSDRYQKAESLRSAMDAHVTRVTEQIAGVIEMSKDFQSTSDTLATNCSREAQTAANLCLAEYVARVIRINELVAQLSWRAGVLPVSEQINTAQRRWQTLWWNDVSWKLRRSFAEMAANGRLLKCQALDFSSSECAADVGQILQPFRDETTSLMCVFSQSMRRHMLALYSLLPKGSERSALLSGVNWQLEESFCAQYVKAPIGSR